MFRNDSTTYIYKIENYGCCERVIKMPVNIFGKCGKKGSIKRDKDDRIDENKLKSSISRSKRNIRRICLSNDFKYFATWTINSEYADRFSVQECQKKMQYILRKYQEKNKNFKYIYVFEKHKNGALHCHGLVKGMPDLREFIESDFDKLPYYILDTIEKGRKIYYSEYFSNKLGYNTFTKIDNYAAVCNYIIKYITKDPVRNENDQVYFCSKGLIKCISEEYKTFFDEDKFFKNTYKTIYNYYNQNTGQIEERLLCEVKDIYPDDFNLATKIDYFIDTTNPDYDI